MERTGSSVPEASIQPDGAMLIEWTDGHQTLLEAAALRAACPCAECRDARDSKGSLRVFTPPDPRSLRLSSIESVGNYAVSLVWGDGHRTGIYPYRLLRGMCDCFGCRLERS